MAWSALCSRASRSCASYGARTVILRGSLGNQRLQIRLLNSEVDASRPLTRRLTSGSTPFLVGLGCLIGIVTGYVCASPSSDIRASGLYDASWPAEIEYATPAEQKIAVAELRHLFSDRPGVVSVDESNLHGHSGIDFMQRDGMRSIQSSACPGVAKKS
jgi:hypothetical protein